MLRKPNALLKKPCVKLRNLDVVLKRHDGMFKMPAMHMKPDTSIIISVESMLLGSERQEQI